jgi:predicted ABC-type ATPase
LIAAGLAPFAPESQNVRAGRLLLQRIDELAMERTNFGFETTLSGRTYVKRLGAMKADGYRLVLFFLWLPDGEMAVERVKNRVLQGGHNVPEADIRRRHGAGLHNLNQLYDPIVDELWLYEASHLPPKLVAFRKSTQFSVEHKDLYERFKEQADHSYEEID